MAQPPRSAPMGYRRLEGGDPESATPLSSCVTPRLSTINQFSNSIEKSKNARALYKMEFSWALADLEAILTPEEQLALKYLLEDYTDEDIARWMGLTRMQFRRGVWWSLQCKAALCGFVPKEGPFAKSQKEPTKKKLKKVCSKVIRKSR